MKEKQEYIKKEVIINLLNNEAEKFWLRVSDLRSSGLLESAADTVVIAQTLDHLVNEFKNMKGRKF